MTSSAPALTLTRMLLLAIIGAILSKCSIVGFIFTAVGFIFAASNVLQ